MRPQNDEPCVDCKFWSNRVGCKIDRYESTSMRIFGYCGFFQLKAKKTPNTK